MSPTEDAQTSEHSLVANSETSEAPLLFLLGMFWIGFGFAGSGVFQGFGMLGVWFRSGLGVLDSSFCWA